MVKCTGRGLVVKRPGVLSKVQVLNLVLGVGVFSLLPTEVRPDRRKQRPDIEWKGESCAIPDFLIVDPLSSLGLRFRAPVRETQIPPDPKLLKNY